MVQKILCSAEKIGNRKFYNYKQFIFMMGANFYRTLMYFTQENNTSVELFFFRKATTNQSHLESGILIVLHFDPITLLV